MSDLHFMTIGGQALPLLNTGAAFASQFGDRWVVQWRSPTQDAVLHIVAGNQTYAMTDLGDGIYTLPKAVYERTGNAAGTYRFVEVRPNAPARALQPTLVVEAAHLDSADYTTIVERLKELALRIDGAATVEDLRGRRVEGAAPGTPLDQFEHWMYPAQQYLVLADVVRRHLTLIQRRPAQGIRLGRHLISASRADRFARADRRDLDRGGSIMCAVPERHLDVEANRLLRYVLTRVLVGHAPVIVGTLDHYCNVLKDRVEPAPTKGNVRTYWKDYTRELQAQVEELTKLKTLVVATSQWAKAQGAVPPLSAVRVDARPPVLRSSRVRRSQDYGPVYAAWEAYRRRQVPQLINQDTSEFVINEAGFQVAETSLLYERWLCLAVYDAFQNFNFKPPSATNRPTKKLKKVENGFEFRKVPYKLQWRGQEDTPSIDLTIQFEPEIKFKDEIGEIKFYKPDIWLSFEVNGGEPVTFALDAKYRNYLAPISTLPEWNRIDAKTHGSYFLGDLIGTAAKKYYYALHTRAAFILHTDERREFKHWGDRPLRSNSRFVAHQYGSVGVRPNAEGTRHLDTLVRCLLMYHLELNCHCWQCGQAIDGKTVSDGKVGRAYQCTCGDPTFWIVSSCTRGHPLVKLGKRSFHQTHSENDYACTCPVCGDALRERPRAILSERT